MEQIFEWNMGGVYIGGANEGASFDLAAADFNDDGIDDYIIGNRNGNGGKGEVIVVFGREMGEQPFFQLQDLEDDEYVILRSDSGLSGISQFGQFSRGIETGDFNGDGIDDIAVSSSRERNAFEDIIGAVSIFYGRGEAETDAFLDTLPGNVWNGADFDGENGFKILGNAPGDSLGAGIFNLGDRDGDGGDELAIATLNIGATPNQLTILWSDNAPLDPSQPIGALPSNRLSVLTDLPGTATFVASVPFEAVDRGPILDLENRLDEFITNSMHADLGIVFNNSSQESPLVLAGNLLMPGTTLRFNDIPAGQSYRALFHGPAQFDVRGSVVTDINGDFTPELWWPFYDAQGTYFGLDWRYIPNTDGQGNAIDSVPFDPLNPPPFVLTFNNPPGDGTAPFAGANVLGADIFGDYARWIDFVYDSIVYNIVNGDIDAGTALLDTLIELIDEPGNLKAMMESLIFIAPDSNQGLGSGLAAGLQPTLALAHVDPEPIFGGGAIDILRNANMTEHFTFDATQWDGDNGYRLFGQDQFGGYGRAQALGDVTGDGIVDLIFSVPSSSQLEVSGSGAVLTLVGGEKNLRAQDAEDGEVDGIIYTTSLDETAELRAGLILQTQQSNTSFGNKIDGIGDINGDGLDDMVVGADQSTVGGISFAGRSFVIFGQHNFDGDMLQVDQLSYPHGFQILGQNSSDRLGAEVRGIGDVNNDGMDDLLVTARQADPLGRNFAGEAYVIYGRASGMDFPSELDPTSLSTSEGYRIQGASSGDFLGLEATALGDVNNDGFDDFAIHRSQGGQGYQDSFGAIHVIFGRNDDLTGPLDLNTLDGTNGFTIEGVEGFSFTGSIASAGDVNGDDINDIILASPFADSAISPVILGSDAGFAATVVVDETTPGIMGSNLRFFGWDNAGAGDMNADGRQDIVLIQAKDTSQGGNEPAKALLYFGKPDLLAGGNDVPADVTFVFRSEYTLEYGDVDFAGDVNGDGFDDLLLRQHTH